MGRLSRAKGNGGLKRIGMGGVWVEVARRGLGYALGLGLDVIGMEQGWVGFEV